MHVEASARKHDVPGEDMLHALRHHWRAYETDDPDVMMFHSVLPPQQNRWRRLL